MKKSIVYGLLCISLFLFVSCTNKNKEIKERFDEVEKTLHASFGENGTHKIVEKDMNLFTILNEVTIIWEIEEEDKDVITNEGKIVRTERDRDVTLKATLQYKGKIRNLTYQITIKKKPVMIHTYTIFFDSQGGSEVEGIIGECETAISKPANPTKEGNIFIGWYLEADSQEEYIFDKIPNRDIKLYAKWEKAKYTIFFDSQGGSEVEGIIEEYETVINRPTNPTKEGNIFIGWYLEEEYQTPYQFHQMPSRDIILYAKWAEPTKGIVYGLKDDDTYEVSDYVGTDSEVYVAEYYQGKRVTSIGEEAFIYNYDLTSILLPDSIISIGELAFKYCTNLTCVILSNNLEIISNAAFARCVQLTDIFIPMSVTTIEYAAFEYCDELLIYCERTEIPDRWFFTRYNDDMRIHLGVEKVIRFHEIEFILIDEKLTITKYLGDESHIEVPSSVDGYPVVRIADAAFLNQYFLKSISLPNTIIQIDKYAFEGCWNLINIILPKDIIYMGEQVFLKCHNLTIYSLASSQPEFWHDDWNATREVYWGSEAGKYEEYKYMIVEHTVIITSYTGNESSLVIPSKINGYPVKKIEKFAFAYLKNLTDITLPDELYFIDDYAFVYCKELQKITFPNSIKNIGKYSFADCNKLLFVYIPGNIDTVYTYSFSSENYLILCFEAAVKPISWTECNENHIRSFWGWNHIIEENDTVYARVNEEMIVIRYLGNESTLVVPESIQGYPIKKIGDGAFYHSKDLIHVTLPNGIEEIGEKSFYYCENLTSIFIPNTVKDIKKFAFKSCENLKEFRVPDNIKIIKESTFSGCESLEQVYIPNGVHTFEKEAFEYCKKLKNILIPVSLKEIGDYVFAACYELETVLIPDSVSIIGEYAFALCYSLVIYCEASSKPNGWHQYWHDHTRGVYWTIKAGVKEVRTSEQLQYIIEEERVIITRFIGTDSKFVVPSKIEGYPVETIGVAAFSYRTNLTEVVIPDSVTHIGEYAFIYCNKLSKIVLPSFIDKIEKFTFYYCLDLIEVNLPNNLATIEAGAFYNCRILSQIFISNQVKNMGENVFFGCENLTIYCEVSSKQNEWANNWNGYRPIIWNAKWIE